MGVRFRKSFKIAPGVKLNVGKKSSSVTFGGKGLHYTINSKGKRTASVGIPGSGIYYTKTNSKSTKSKNRELTNTYAPYTGKSSSEPPQNQKEKWYQKTGWIIFFLIIFPPLGIVLMWLFKKGIWNNRLKTILTAVSLLWFIIALLLSNAKNNSENALRELKSEESEKPTSSEAISQNNDIDLFSLLNNFIELYNASVRDKITDIQEMDINGDDYRTEFRLPSFDNAVGLKGKIDGNLIEIVNYGSLSNDAIRIYLTTTSYDTTVKIFAAVVNVFDDSIPSEEINKICNDLESGYTANILFSGNSDISGYINETNEHNYNIMIDCSKLNFK